MQVTHNEIQITYDEESNKWLFTLRGRDRAALSLAEAKAAINKQPAEKREPFKKIPAWEIRMDDPKKVEITGWGEQYGSPAAWISDQIGRRKERIEFQIYPSTPENDLIVEQIIAKRAEVRRINGELTKLKSRLQKLEIPKD